jgi:hypothetical protein
MLSRMAASFEKNAELESAGYFLFEHEHEHEHEHE